MAEHVSHEALMVEIKGIHRRLDQIEERQDEMRQEFSELRGGKKALLWLWGAGATIAGLAIAAWAAMKG